MKSVIFKRVVLQNFLSVGNNPVVVHFKEGLNIITGSNKDKPDRVNAIGKSTIADAIYFGVFGEPLRDIKKDLIVNNLTGGTACVELDVDIDNSGECKSYKIQRTINPSKVNITCDDVDITCDSIANTNKFIGELLNATPAIFQNCVIMTVNNAIPFMAKNKVEKRKFIEDIFGLEIFSDMLSILRNKYNEIKKVTDTETTKTDEINRSLVNYNTQKQKTLDYRKNKLQVYLGRQQTNTVEKEKFSTELSEIVIPNVEDIQTKNVKLLQALKTCDDRITDKITTISEVKANVNLTQTNLSKIGTENPQCPVCLRDIKEHDVKHIEDEKLKLKSAITEGKNNIQNLIKELDVLKDKKDQINKTIKNNDQLISNQKLIEQKRKNIQDKIDQINKWQESLVQDIEQMKQNDTEFDEIIENTQARLTEVTSKVNELTQELSVLDIVKYVVSEEGVKSYIVNKLLELLNSKLVYYLKKLDSNAICYFNEFFEEEIVNEKNKICSYFNFSGAERKSIDLACLFTFSDLRRMQGGVQYNIAIYDELFDSSFDDKGIELIVEILKERVSKFGESAYVISHRKESLKAVTGEVVFLEKTGGITSRVEYIE